MAVHSDLLEQPRVSAKYFSQITDYFPSANVVWRNRKIVVDFIFLTFLCIQNEAMTAATMLLLKYTHRPLLHLSSTRLDLLPLELP